MRMTEEQEQKNGPLRIDIDPKPGTSDSGPAEAPPIPELHAVPAGRALENLIRSGAHTSSWLARLFWWLLGLLTSMALALWGWDLVAGLIGRNSLFGSIALVLTGLFALVLLAITLRELAGFARLRRLDGIRAEAGRVLATDDPGAARALTRRITRLYARRSEVAWAVRNFEDQAAHEVDAAALLTLVEAAIMAPLDAAARLQVETAARQVATVTALVPLAFADLLVALVANMRMIRRIAEIYGGRTGALGSWRLTRAVLAHLVATGFVALGDDLIGSVAGGSVLAKFSRRFGEGIVNGALTARVGIAAMEICRPLPFNTLPRPRITSLLSRALSGVFGAGNKAKSAGSDENMTG